MKYFTPKLWKSLNGSSRVSALKTYNRQLSAYQRQLEVVLPKLAVTARTFFHDICLLHDATLVRMSVGDCIDASDYDLRNFRVKARTASAKFLVLAASGEDTYSLNYDGVQRIEVNLPGKLKLFPIGQSTNFGDWGYDELTSTENGLFRHEVLFSSGATIAIDFARFTFQRKNLT